MDCKTLFVLSILCSFIYYIIKSDKTIHILQQNWYNEGNRYLKWIKENPKKAFVNFDILFVIFFTGLFISRKYLAILFIVFYGICALIFVKNRKKEQVKKPCLPFKNLILF